MSNLDEHLEEHLAEKAAKEAAEKAKREAEYEAERKERLAVAERVRKQRVERDNKFLASIANALVAMCKATGSNRKIVHDSEKGTLSIAGVDVTSLIHIAEDEKIVERRYRYGNKTAGKGTFSIRIGRGYNRRDLERFKQKKDGSHDYPGIAQMLMSHASRVINTVNAQNQQERNKPLADALIAELAVSTYSGVGPSADADKPIFIDLSRIYSHTQVLSVDDARALLKDLRKYGFRLNYSDKKD